VLLSQILRELKSMNRHQSFRDTEFSVLKLLAGVVQMVVLLCLVLAFMVGSGPEANTGTAHSWLLLGLVLQTLTLTLLMLDKGGS